MDGQAASVLARVVVLGVHLGNFLLFCHSRVSRVFKFSVVSLYFLGVAGEAGAVGYAGEQLGLNWLGLWFW